MIQTNPNGRLTVTNTSLRASILRAYGIHQSQLIGAPAWITMERFDVNARTVAPRGVRDGAAGQRRTRAGGADSNQPMLIVALEEQLGLKLESRRTDVPVVVVDSVERPTAD